jgi:glycerophosphoryl diester phosphodiesterase
LRLPVENTLRAYVEAWTEGFHLAECDITSTTDEQLFLLHDEDFERVALIGDQSGTQLASSMSWEQVQNVTLKDGSHPTSLVSCLQMAKNLSIASSFKQLVIELKPDGMFPATDAPIDPAQEERDALTTMRLVHSLTKLLDQNSELLPHVGLVFSFGRQAMRGMSEWKRNNGKDILLFLLTEGSRWVKQNKSVYVDLSNRRSLEQAVNVAEGMDGLYLEFEPEMLVSGSRTQANLKWLCSEMLVGVWMYVDQPDGLDVCNDGRTVYQVLSDLGVLFVNANIKASSGM